jgi:predicted O-methyltransferase YrrM
MRRQEDAMTRDEILELLDRPLESAAVGAALELGLFWQLQTQARSAAVIGDGYGIPHGRCEAWLAVLVGAGLVEASSAGYRPTAAARAAILDTHSRETWRMLAQEARERLAKVRDLPAGLKAAPPARPPRVDEYVLAMAEDPDRARRFTRMLFELHQGLADQVAASLDLAGVRRLMDLGGGSGVVAMALARRWPDLSITVLDIANVCNAGRELVETAKLADRVFFRPADFLRDDLPAGFDTALECDVGAYSRELFERIRTALAPGGRFIVVDRLAHPDAADPSRAAWAMVRTLADPSWQTPTLEGTRELMEQAGFVDIGEHPLPAESGKADHETGLVVVEGTAPRS